MKHNHKYLLITLGAICLTFLGCSSKNADMKPDQGTNITPASTEISTLALSPTPSTSVSSVTEYLPTKDNVKLLGRTTLIGDTLWLSLSASGIEFTFTGTKADITLKGDNIAITGNGGTHYCRVAIYVNDELVSDELLKEPLKTITAFESQSEETVTIRVVKLSETADSTLGISKISVTSKDAIKPTQDKAHKIEFIGDSNLRVWCGR